MNNWKLPIRRRHGVCCQRRPVMSSGCWGVEPTNVADTLYLGVSRTALKKTIIERISRLLDEHNVRRYLSRMRTDKWKRYIIVYDLHKAEKLPYSLRHRRDPRRCLSGRKAANLMPGMPFKETMQKPLSLLKKVGTGSAFAYRSPTKHRWLEVNQLTFCFNTTSLIDKKEKQHRGFNVRPARSH